ncbi:site-specific integrase, partial [Candidatus Microgenomates bacterium]|nr:site-specific integrase [Candidatus Microgenomates bacterium]
MNNNLSQVSPQLVQAYQQEIANRGGSEATVKRKLSSLNKFFDWATQEGHILKNPIQPHQNTQLASGNFVSGSDNKTSKYINKGTIFTLSGMVAILILLLLLIPRVKLPIPFKIGFGEETANSTITSPAITNNNSTNKAVLLSPWTIYTKLNLSGSNSSNQTVTFKLYKSATNGDVLWTSESKQISTDANGNSLIALDNVPTDLFLQNDRLYLGVTADGKEFDTRMEVPTANTATNLSDYYPSQNADINNIPVISSDGSLNLASQTAAIKATNGTLSLEGQAVTITSSNMSDGDIVINPDGNGKAKFIFEGNSGNQLSAISSNLNSGSLLYGAVSNNSTGYDLLKLQSGSKLTTQFSVDSQGNTYIGGNTNVDGGLNANSILTNDTTRLTQSGQLTNITGYSQSSGNFSIVQSPGDTATITKNGTALSDVLTLTLDERGKPLTSNTGYSTLTLKRYDGAREAFALNVDEGNAKFDGQIVLGNYTSNPGSVHDGSIIYNSTDGTVYFWNGSSWVAMGGSGIDADTFDGLDSTQFLRSDTSDNYTSGTLTLDSGTTLDVNGDVSIADTNIVLDG